MQSTAQKDEKQAGLSELVAILDREAAPPMMLEPPNLHADPVDHAISLGAPLPPPDPALRAAPPRKASFAGRLARAFLAIAVGAAATVGWLSYGEAARQMLAAWAPQLVAAQPSPTDDVKVAEQQTEQQATPAETVAEPTPAQPAAAAAVTPPPAQETPAAPAQAEPVQTAAAAPDLTPRVEEMAREIASLRETIEQLKSHQQQLTRDLAKATEQQEPRRKTTSSAPKPTATAAASRNPSPPPQPATTPPQQRQVYAPPRDQGYGSPRDSIYTSPRDPVYASPREVYADPPRVYTPQVYVPPPPSSYEPGAPRPPRPLP
jgi:hypothetical protein